MMRSLLVIIVAGFFNLNNLWAQNIVAITDSVDQYIFTYQDLSYLEDTNGVYTVDDILGNLRNSFKHNTLYSVHNQNLSSWYWVRIKIKGNPSSRNKWLLECFDQTIDSIEAYLPAGNGSYHKIIMGDHLPFAYRDFMHKNFEIELPNTSNDTQEYYFRIKSSTHVNMIIVLRSVSRFIYYSLNEYFIFGLFYGMILVVAIYNLLMFFAIRERSYIVYILYVLSVGLYTMCSDGIAFQYLWPHHPAWNDKAFGIALFSIILWALIFTKMFLHTHSRHPLINRILNSVIIIRAVIFLVALFIFPRLFEYRWIEFLPLSIAFYAGAYSYFKGYKAARFFALAYGLLFIGFLIKLLINLNVPLLPGTIITHYSITISFWFEMWLLSFALADKVKIIKATKDRALRRIIHQHEVNQNLKDKVNRELETEVEKRTREITEQKIIIEHNNVQLLMANQKLNEQSAEITRMNSLLDRDNYALKRNIQEEMLARAGSKNMTYDEFEKIFPDNLSCLRYLEDLKWKDGFVCKKCSHTKYHSGKNTFDRRCTRCGYDESPTAFTVFRGIKFPLTKAFYILHLIITERNDVTIDELSAIISLRRNTCWSFKDKVSRLIQKQHWTKDQTSHWEQIIFSPDVIDPVE